MLFGIVVWLGRAEQTIEHVVGTEVDVFFTRKLLEISVTKGLVCCNERRALGGTSRIQGSTSAEETQELCFFQQKNGGTSTISASQGGRTFAQLEASATPSAAAVTQPQQQQQEQTRSKG